MKPHKAMIVRTEKVRWRIFAMVFIWECFNEMCRMGVTP